MGNIITTLNSSFQEDQNQSKDHQNWISKSGFLNLCFSCVNYQGRPLPYVSSINSKVMSLHLHRIVYIEVPSPSFEIIKGLGSMSEVAKVFKEVKEWSVSGSTSTLGPCPSIMNSHRPRQVCMGYLTFGDSC